MTTTTVTTASDVVRQTKRRELLLTVGAPLLAGVIALVAASVVLLISGSNPLTAYGQMLRSAGNLETIVDTLNNAAPLYLSAVAAAIGFKMNLFNIGVEGQYLWAALVAGAVGAAFTAPPFIHVSVILLVAMATGAAYAGIAGWLKVSRGVNEVISTIMLNAIALSGLLVEFGSRWEGQAGNSNVKGTGEIADSGLLPSLNPILEVVTPPIGRGRELSSVLLIAAVVGVVYYLFLNRSVLGFDLRASGQNAEAARFGGISPKRMIMLAMLLSGAVAGLVGIDQLLSDKGRWTADFQQGLGYAGIAVALLGRNNPVGIAFAALLFGFLDATAGVLQIGGSAPPEIVKIIQGVILLAAVISYQLARQYKERDEARAMAAAKSVAADVDELASAGASS